MDWIKKIKESSKAILEEGLVIFEGNKEMAIDYLNENSCASSKLKLEVINEMGLI